MGSHISIFVKEMRINLRIGLYEQERKGAQPVDVHVELFTDLSYLSEVDADKIIDYSKIHTAVKSWEGRDHVDLIETYLNELIEISFAFPRVNAVKASIAKPDILKDAAAAGLSVFVRRDDWAGLR